MGLEIKHWYSKGIDRNMLKGKMLKVKALNTKAVKSLVVPLLMMQMGVANAALIKVTTTADHFGEDADTCSLREAIEASLIKEPFGGCVAGTKNFTDIIKLEDKKVYQLEDELIINRKLPKFFKGLRIDGPENIDQLARDEIIGSMGKRLKPSTTIKAAEGKRILNTSAYGLSAILNNVKILGSASPEISKGGAFLVGGALTLNNVVIENAQAQNGGAIFLEGENSSVSLEQTRVENNKAGIGAAISQFCFDNLNFDKRKITIKNSSIVNNATLPLTASQAAAKQTSSIIKLCGVPKVLIENTTIAKNIVENNKGASLIDALELKSFKSSVPELRMTHVTMVGNSHGLLYESQNKINIINSIVAFNAAYDCKYVGQKINEITNIAVQDTLMTGNNTRENNACQLPLLKNKIIDKSNTFTSGTLQDYFVGGELADYGLGLKGYLPKHTQEGASVSPLVLLTPNRCKGKDKRGFPRILVLPDTNKKSRSCYRGAIERGRLFARNDALQSNKSYASFINILQAKVDQKPNEKFTAKDLAIFNDIKRFNTAFFQAYKNSYDKTKNAVVKDYTGFRQVYVSILDNDIPYETDAGRVELFPSLRGLTTDKSDYVIDSDKYNVTIDKVGTGSAENKGNSLTEDNNLRCRWDQNLQQLIVWRLDLRTPAGVVDYCHYTISLKSNPNIKSSAFAVTRVENIPPTAENVTITTAGNEERVAVDLSKSISDDGDGPNRPNALPEFFTNSEGASYYIEIIRPPEVGRLEFSGGSEDCPNPNSTQVDTGKCYAGNITYVRDNVFSDFGDTFTYRVHDGGATFANESVDSKASNTATVYINVNRRIGPATPVYKGGGSWSWFGIFGLISLLLARRFMYMKTMRETLAK